MTARITMPQRNCKNCCRIITVRASASYRERRSAKYCSLRCYRDRGHSDPERHFESHFMPEPMSGCWLWIGAGHPKGYGTFSIMGKMMTAHRASWTIYNGAIPSDLHVLHRCDNRICVNPDHLFLGTNQDNVDDRQKKMRQRKLLEGALANA